MVRISKLVEALIPQAIEQVSEGTEMFTIRNLFYAVRELFLKKYPNMRFYKNYDSFTQDFMRSYERRHGRIRNMIREARGSMSYADEYGWDYKRVIETGTYLRMGRGDKIILVEKEGIFRLLVANNFHKRFDACIICTQGFSIEACRDILLEAERRGVPICVLHDYDVNGVLIHETLTQPTKRLDTYLHRETVVDLGINYEVVAALKEERDLTPEPVSLSRQDESKLEGMLSRGEITDEEYKFLSEQRVELNALTPRELMEWLADRLRELGFWKVIPTEEELEKVFIKKWEEEMDSRMEEVRTEIGEGIKKKLMISDIEDWVDDIKTKIRSLIRKETTKRLKSVKPSEVLDVEELKELLEDDEEKFWTIVARDSAKEQAEEDFDEVEERIENEREDIEKTVVVETTTMLSARIEELREILDELYEMIE